MELQQLASSSYQHTLPLRSFQSSVEYCELSEFWSFTTRGQIRNMVVQKILVLLLFITQALCAPSGCTESCTYIKQHGTQIAGIQDHAGLSESALGLQGLDYSRPGTWSEHNDYNTDNGHGKVHEERGQFADGSKTVRYYKKNYTSSYSTGQSYGAGLSNVEHQSNRHAVYMPNTDEILNSQKAYSQVGNLESNMQQQKYNNGLRQQHAESLHRSTNEHSARLEDFGEYSGSSHATQSGVSDLNTQVSQGNYNLNKWPENWSKVDSYKTDDGHGRVFEEEGQYTAGAKKIRYFKRNYTSSYSSSDGIPISDIAKTGVQDMHTELEELNKKIGKEYSQTSTAEHIGLSNAGQTHSANSNYRNRDNYGSSGHRNGEHFRESANEQLSYINPSQNMHGRNSYNIYESHEGHVTQLQSGNQLINPTTGYTSVLSNGNTGYHRNMFRGATLQQETDNVQQEAQLDAHQSKFIPHQQFLDNLRGSAHMQNSGINLGTPGQQSHYEEHQSSHHIKQSAVPQHSTDTLYMNQHQARQHPDTYIHQFKDGEVTSIRKTHLGKLITGALDLSQARDSVDCDSDRTLGNSQYRHKFKRSAKYNEQDEVQQTGSKDIADDFTQQTGNLEFDQESQQFYHPWNSNPINQNVGDVTQQMDEFDDLTPQTSEKLEFGQESQQSYQTWNPTSANQKVEHLTQQTGKLDDLSPQASGKLEFGQESQQSYQPWDPTSGNQNLDDITQQTGELDDLSQQTSGKLEFGQESQQSYQPWDPTSGKWKLDDLTQQTGELDDLSQQISGKLELGQEPQQSYQPWKPTSANQKIEDLTQQTGELDNLSQQTSGNLKFGQKSQQSYQPWKPTNGNQKVEDLTQQTGELDDLSQQTSGKLEFGQESQQFYQPWVPTSANQKVEDLTQQTGELDDLPQQTSGKFEFGQESQQSYQPWDPTSANQKVEDLIQQTGELDDLSQQSSGNLEVEPESQQSYQPWKPTNANQKIEDLTQQTGELDNLSQQSSGNLEVGPESQQSYQPWKPTNANQKIEDLTQQTGELDNLSRQTSGNLEVGQESQQSYQPWKPTNGNQKVEDLTQQTGELDDLSQKTSGKLEFGPESQQSYQPWKPTNANQKIEDLTQQTGELDNLSQQTSGNLEVGQESQQSYQPWKLTSGSQKIEDLTQQTGELDNLSQQTSGKLEFGPESQQSYQPWNPTSANQKVEDLTQQTGELEDLSQQTSGNLEFGQESQQSYQPWKPTSANQKVEDLTQQTGELDDLPQQTSGKLEFGPESQQSYQPWKLTSGSQKIEDLTQQTGELDNLSQQTSGKLEFGQESQQSYQPWNPTSANQKVEDLTQQTGELDDLQQQTSGNLEFGQESQQSYQPWKPSNVDKILEDIFQQTDDISPQQGLDSHSLKPAGKPKPASRYFRTGSMINLHLPNQNIHITNSPTSKSVNNANTDAPIIYELPPQVDTEHNTDIIWDQNMNGNLDLQSTINKDVSQNLNGGYDTEGGNVDQVNWLHKSNDATVGLQWHYTYHPSDQRQFVQQTDQKDKEGMQQQTIQDKLFNLHQSTDQETQSKYMHEDSYQQPGSNWQSHNHASEGVKTIRRKFTNLQQNKFMSNQHVISGNEEAEENIRSSETTHQLEPRILEAYGGGSYDPSHEDNIYSGVRVNPSAILPPTSNVDPWYVREKPREFTTTTEESTSPPSPVEPLDNDAIVFKENSDTNETTPSSVWSRIGHKITSTIDKAKEKAKNIFG